MRRRRFLGAVGAGLLAASAGCAAGGSDGAAAGGSAAPTPDETQAADENGASVAGDPDLPLGESDLVRAAGKDDIPAIVDPVFAADWSAVPETLGDRDRVIGVEIDGTARAYPLAILNWHEVVNDTLGGPLLVTYCPLCGSGVTAERRVDGRETTFGVSGYLWQRDLVLYDERTESLWSQILGQAVRGERTDDRLALVPSTLTTWGEWRGTHPDTEVLVPPPESGTITGRGRRNYNTNPYSDYEAAPDPSASDSDSDSDGRLPSRALVLGVTTGEAARAYWFKTVLEVGGVVNDRVGETPVVVASTHDSLVAYVRRVEGDVLRFDRDGDALTAGGSRWEPVSGRAREGPHEGTTLERANDRSPMFWFAWRDFFPGTSVYGETE